MATQTPDSAPFFAIGGNMNLSSVNWIKVIATDGGIGYAYTRKHLESIGKNVLDYNGVTVFPLGFRNKNALSPKLGEAIVLIQKGKLTHIVEVLDEVLTKKENGTLG